MILKYMKNIENGYKVGVLTLVEFVMCDILLNNFRMKYEKSNIEVSFMLKYIRCFPLYIVLFSKFVV